MIGLLLYITTSRPELCLVYVYVLDISLILKRHILKQWKWFLDTLITLLITVYFIQNQAHLL